MNSGFERLVSARSENSTDTSNFPAEAGMPSGTLISGDVKMTSTYLFVPDIGEVVSVSFEPVDMNMNMSSPASGRVPALNVSMNMKMKGTMQRSD